MMSGDVSFGGSPRDELVVGAVAITVRSEARNVSLRPSSCWVHRSPYSVKT
jgi:hypothetical protein